MQGIFIQKIWQIDRFHFAILWTDGLETTYRLSNVQAHCPCVACRSVVKEKKRNDQITAKKLLSVGSYAIKIIFTQGCSNGIYPYSLLRKIGGVS